MAEQQTATCRNALSDDLARILIVFGCGLLGHLACRQPRVLSAEERTRLLAQPYCREPTRSLEALLGGVGKSHLREVVHSIRHLQFIAVTRVHVAFRPW